MEGLVQSNTMGIAKVKKRDSISEWKGYVMIKGMNAIIANGTMLNTSQKGDKRIW